MSEYPSEFSLSQLNGHNGFSITLDSGNPDDGLAISAAGDVNGDGIDDFLVGTKYNTAGTYVVFGHDGPWKASLDLSRLDGDTGFLVSSDTYDGFGWSNQAGDINGDGITDVVISARGADPGGVEGAGSAYVVFGHAGPWDASFDVTALDGSNGFRLDGGVAYGGVGYSVSGAGDVNGDGIEDLVVGAQPTTGTPGSAYVVFGRADGWAPSLTLSTLGGSDGFRFDGLDGCAVSDAGDVNGDGFGDVLIGSFDADSRAGESYLIFGHGGGWSPSLTPADLDGINGVRIEGADANDWSGRSVSSAGDVNGDGLADIVIGAYLADGQRGAAYVIFGRETGWAPTINLGALGKKDGFELTGTSSFARIGISVSSAGDFNGDGYDDVIVGAQGAHTWEGAAYVLFGHRGGWKTSYDLPQLNGDDGFIIRSDGEHSYTGEQVSDAGDINHDGFDDLLVTAYTGRGDAVSETYVIFGREPREAVDRVGDGLDQSIHGGELDDILSGRGGQDALYGHGGADSLVGGNGADTLIGGAGGDTLSGGQGPDTFAFASTSDSKASAADLIEDLQAIDRIDLSAIDADRTLRGDQTFVIVQRLDGHAGELEVHYDHLHGRTVVKADVDGDGVADMRIEIAGHVADPACFIL